MGPFAYNPLSDAGLKPSAVHKPDNAEKLQQVVMEANRTAEKLVPVSSSEPHQKGGIVCREPHSIVDLSEWKQVLDVDRRNRVVMIEPGVTYPELASALEPHGLTVSLPFAVRSGKSVLAAVLDREPSTWPNKQWDIADPLASMEVVFGDGSLFRTGAAGGPGSLEKQRASGGAQKSPMGPAQTDFHRLIGGSQGSLGIAAWISVRCELMPSITEPRLTGSETITPLADFVYAVHKAGLGEHCFILDRSALSMLLGEEPAKSGNLPEYIVLINVCGFQRLPRERVEYQLADLADLAQPFDLRPAKKLEGVSARDVLDRALSPRGDHGRRGDETHGCLSLFFLSTLDRAPFFIEVFQGVLENHGVARHGYGMYLQPVVQNHACHYEFVVPFNSSNADEVQKMKDIEKAAARALTEAGAFWSRPYGAAADIEPGRDRGGHELLKKVKKVFDPRGVLSPGRFGL